MFMVNHNIIKWTFNLTRKSRLINRTVQKQCTSLFGGVFLDNTTKLGNLAHSFDKASILNEEGCVHLFTYLQNLARWLPRLKNFIIEPIIR